MAANAVVAFHITTCVSCAPRTATTALVLLSSSSFAGGFDSDRMEALTQRGELEASLMQTSLGVLGEATRKNKKMNEKKKKSPSAKMAARTLRQDGVVRLDRILSSDTASKLRDDILGRRDAALASIQSGRANGHDNHDDWRNYFADVLLKGDQGQRCDLLLPLAHNAMLQIALYEILVSSKLLYNTLVSALGGDDITLYELSALISEPGSPRQPVHPDNPHQQVTPLVTVFIALQDITREMGPTNFLPKSNTAAVHAVFNDVPKRDELLQNSHSVVALLKAGDASLFDSRTLHCGGANDREEGATRVLMYMSFRNPRATEPIGNVGSMMPGIERMTLREFRNKLIAAEKSRVDNVNSSNEDSTDHDDSVRLVDPFDGAQAAELGDALAQLKLGNNYYLGEGGVESNLEEAVRWFQLASKQGLAQASFNLGVCHFEGKGVPGQDLTRALELFTLAAEKGHPGAKEARDEVLVMIKSGLAPTQESY